MKLHYKGAHLTLSKLHRRSGCKLTSLGMLENFVIYGNAKGNFAELNQLQFFQPQGRHGYSNEMLRYALLHRYTSRQAYSLLLEEFSLPSLSYLKTLSQGGVEPVKALELMLQNGKISKDCVLLVDEM